ncbi:O-antigen ligase family protein [Microbacterium sp. NPDC016588]
MAQAVSAQDVGNATPSGAVRTSRVAEVALSVALVTAVFQFLEVLPFAPLSVWWLFLSVLALVGIPKPRWPAAVALLLALANVAASIWSPVPLEALRMASNFAALAVAMALALHVLSSNEARITRPFAWAAVPIAIQSLATLVFFVSPETEQKYFDWSYAPYFSGVGVKLLFTTGFNNVALPEKAGGFFLNGNTASMFMAMTAWLYFGLGVRYRRKWMIAFAVVPFGGAIATGSKTALLLTMTSLLLLLLLTAVRRSMLAGFAVAMVLPLAGLFAVSTLSSAEAFSADAAHTVGSRGRIWDLAVSAITRNPILGLGYGGWIKFFGKEGGFIGFDERPAHNLFLQAWLDGGLVYLVMIAGFALICVFTGLRALRNAKDTRQALASAAVLMSLIWVFAHGLADNTWVYGEWHSLPFFGVGVVIVAVWASGNPVANAVQLAGSEESVRESSPLTTHDDIGGGRVRERHEVETRPVRRCAPDCPFPHSGA